MWNTCILTGMAILALAAGPVKQEAFVYDPSIPEEIQEACERYGAEYDICPELLEAICYYESRYIADVSNKDCKGLMQINEPVQKERMEKLGVTDIYDVDSNIHTGADLLGELFSEYKDVGTVLMLYHGEKDAVKKGNAGKLSKYAQRIINKSEKLERAHGK